MRPDGHVFWAYSASTITFTQAYQDIARKLKLPGHDNPNIDQSDLVVRWLDEENSHWLMILDNADDSSSFFPLVDSNDSAAAKEHPSKRLSEYLPVRMDALKALLVTTRSRILGTDLAHGLASIQVQPFSFQEAKDLLEAKLGMDAPASLKEGSDKLLPLLGYIPLAITQAASFVRRNRISVSEYCAALEKDKTNLIEHLSQELQDARRQRRSPNSVYRTWKITFDYLRMYESSAARILSLAAIYDNQRIPTVLLRPLLDKDVEYSTATGTLDGYSLIILEADGKTVELHPLVRASVQPADTNRQLSKL